MILLFVSPNVFVVDSLTHGPSTLCAAPSSLSSSLTHSCHRPSPPLPRCPSFCALGLAWLGSAGLQIGEVVFRDAATETGAVNRLHCAALVANNSRSMLEVRSIHWLTGFGRAANPTHSFLPACTGERATD
eukprot:GHVU01011134.1.p1 GENE.GHVU01011134.1~~GHVU01011134.1.p1  ORF type:complete len:131 (+),score=9.00 GHVU01011134.1:47-439(+)